MNQLEESLQLFKAMSGLPEQQLDVMVLRRLYGICPERVSWTSRRPTSAPASVCAKRLSPAPPPPTSPSSSLSNCPSPAAT
ncbi:sigma-70 family RNA polymerase sigma factor [Streptomyces xantholiticus]|uniref:sigma-70 family RNA polymerase sigma factor n=1 Tax=Streptomyces xantholiticus TaxID=68285 RepID=UPI001678FA40|nr:sigma-70 family RNA polymerase sigma factor [Streptomyces xantholiticus]